MDSESKRELVDLLEAACNHGLSEVQFSHLQALLTADADARQFYLQYMSLDSNLALALGDDSAKSPLARSADVASIPAQTTAAPTATPHVVAPQTSATRRSVTLEKGWRGIFQNFAHRPLSMATLVLALVSGGVLIWKLSNPSPLAQPQQQVARTPQVDSSSRPRNAADALNTSLGPSRYVANITGGSKVEWENTSSQPSPNARLLAGQVLEFRSGLLEVTFSNGAVVLLQGPALFSLGDGQSTTLVRGKLTADVPKSAVGFTVATPAVNIVDLGTRFGVDVANGVTKASVFKGEVKAQPLGQNARGEFLRLAAGEGAQFAVAGGTAVRTPAQAGGFVRQLPDRVQSVAVADVATSSRNLIAPKSVRSNIVESIHPLGRMIDGSGLFGDGPELTRLHRGNDLPDDDKARLLDDSANWKAVITFLPIDLEFDLGDTFDLARVHIWNYAHPAPGFAATERDARHVALWLSRDGADYQPAGSIELKTSTAGIEHVQSFPLTGRARYVRLRLASSYGAGRGSEVGLGEVRFEGNPGSNKPGGNEAK